MSEISDPDFDQAWAKLTNNTDSTDLKQYTSPPIQHSCPRCGYCPHCGRGGLPVMPWYPAPYQPLYPYYPSYPLWTIGPQCRTGGWS